MGRGRRTLRRRRALRIGAALLAAIALLCGLLGGSFLGGDSAAARDAIGRPVAALELARAPRRSPLALATGQDPRRAAAADAAARDQITGRVVWPEGVPADEEVHVIAKGAGSSNRAERQRVPVGADGAFRLGFVDGDERVELTLEARYCYLPERVRLRPAEVRAPIELRAGLGARLEGRLVPPVGRGPGRLAGERVRVVTPGARSRRVQVGADGAFVANGLRPGENVFARMESEDWPTATTESFTLRPGQTHSVLLSVPTPVRVAGRVIGADGRALAGVVLRLERDWETVGFARTGSDGRYGFVVSPGPARFAARLDDYITHERELELEAGQGFEDEEIVLAEVPGVGGRVTWPDGAPAVGARLRGLDWSVRCIGAGEADCFGTTSELARTTTTDGDGRFHLPHLYGGPYTVAANYGEMDAELPAAWGAAHGVSPGEQVELVLMPGRTLRGRVVDDLGRPLREATVMFGGRHHPDAPTLLPTDRVHMARCVDGEFEIRGAPNRYLWVWASGDRVVSERSTIGLPLAEPLELVIPRVASLGGRVVGPAGEPVSDATVRIRYRSGYGAPRPDGVEPLKEHLSQRTGADGRFRFERVPTLGGLMRVTGAGYVGGGYVPLELQPGTEVADWVVRLARPGGIVAQLHAEISDRAERSVQVFYPSGASRWAKTDTTGVLELPALAPGLHTLVLTHRARTSGGAAGSNFRSSVEVHAGEIAHEVLGGAQARVHGRVTRAGAPLAGIDLAFRAEGGFASDARSGVDGRYEVELPALGVYEVTVGRALFERSFDGHTRTDFELSSGRFDGRLSAPDGSPVAALRATLERVEVLGSQPKAIVELELHGRNGLRATDLVPGRYWLRVSPKAPRVGRPYAWLLEEVVVREPAAAYSTQLLHLAPAATIRGRILGADGFPVEGACLNLITGTGTRVVDDCAARSSMYGEFALEQVPGGVGYVQGEHRGRVARSPAISIRAGEEATLELRFEE